MNQERGITLVELMVAVTISGIFVSLIMYFTFSYWRYGYLLEADLDTFITRLNAGDVLREAFGTSSGLVTQNSIPDSNTLNPDPAIASNLYWVPIHAVPGNTTVSSGTTPLLYYRRFSVNTSGSVIMNGVQPYQDEYVLYINGSTKQLLIRSLANTFALNNRLQTSCPPALASTACPADKVIANDLSSVDKRFFSRSGNIIDYTSIVDGLGNYIGPDYPTVEVIELGLNITKKPIFQTTTSTINSTIIRIALRNS